MGSEEAWRQAFFYRRFFHSRRSACFDLALGGAALALVARRRVPLAAAAPYAFLVAQSARRWGVRRAPLVAITEAVADGVGAVALLRGSAASGSLLL